MFGNGKITGEITRQFKEYYEINIERIKTENFQNPFEDHVEDLVLFEYYAETNLSPFEGDEDCLRILEFKNNLFTKLLKVDEQWRALKN